MNRRDFLKLMGGVAGLALTGCPVKLESSFFEESTDVDETEDYTLVEVVEQTLRTGFEQPDELAAEPEVKEMVVKNANANSNKKDVAFCTTPLMDYYQTYFVQNPIIYKYTKGNHLVNFFEFGSADISEFRIGLSNEVNPGQPNTDVRPRGLALSTIILNDGSVLFASNMSQKIHEIDTQGNKQIYLDDERLVGITDMVLGSDGKVYCAQGPIFYPDPSLGLVVIRKTGVISIDANKNINTEFELPGAAGTGFTYGLDNNETYSGTGPFTPSNPPASLMLGHLVKIHENKRKDVKNVKFYVSDMFEKTVYDVDDNNNVNVLKTGLRYPSTLTMGNDGKLFLLTGIITDQLFSGGFDIASGYEPELIVINPKKNTTRSVHKLMNEGGGYGGYMKDVVIDQTTKYLPIGQKLSAILVSETSNTIEFYVNNSINGNFRSLVARKLFDP